MYISASLGMLAVSLETAWRRVGPYSLKLFMADEEGYRALFGRALDLDVVPRRLPQPASLAEVAFAYEESSEPSRSIGVDDI